jgi:hypothetical protein
MSDIVCNFNRYGFVLGDSSDLSARSTNILWHLLYRTIHPGTAPDRLIESRETLQRLQRTMAFGNKKYQREFVTEKTLKGVRRGKLEN